jgi:hypothetical protein
LRKAVVAAQLLSGFEDEVALPSDTERLPDGMHDLRSMSGVSRSVGERLASLSAGIAQPRCQRQPLYAGDSQILRMALAPSRNSDDDEVEEEAVSGSTAGFARDMETAAVLGMLTARHYSERLLLVDGLGASFEQIGRGAVRSATSASDGLERDIAVGDGKAVDADAVDVGGAGVDAFSLSMQSPSMLGAVPRASVSLAGASDAVVWTRESNASLPDSQQESSATWQPKLINTSGAIVINLAWTVVKMNADHLSVISTALKVSCQISLV